LIDPTKLYQKMYDAGADWSDKDAAANLLEETKKSVLADIMQEVAHRAAAAGESATAAALERIALANAAYKEHVRAMVEARREANKARAQYDAIRTYIELVRTVESTKRAEMQMR
jgi:hypothetical protein